MRPQQDLILRLLVEEGGLTDVDCSAALGVNWRSTIHSLKNIGYLVFQPATDENEGFWKLTDVGKIYAANCWVQ